MSRRILGDGLRAPNVFRSHARDASLFLMGPSTRPEDPFAAETVLEIEADGKTYMLPAKYVADILKREGIE